ncbi:unnamed protein product [Linum tenue]|uniref:Uncharacterized protein n=1 Tax=Linum tenue TaxID=586396 RepID=A0AAV0LYJ0_9ROSI|nr:unnamed protein product [Linum tenue]
MRFLIDFVSCCRSADCESSSTREVSGSTTGRRRTQSEETRALVKVSTAAVCGAVAVVSSSNSPRGGRRRVRKRSRTGTGARPGSEAEWKPSLAAISEDKAAAAAEEKARREKERAVKRKDRNRSRDSSSFNGEDYRRSGNQFAGAFPGFPAAPFMI